MPCQVSSDRSNILPRSTRHILIFLISPRSYPSPLAPNRAELCQAQLKAQVVRAQKAVLKKEVREMWSKQSPLSRGPSSRSPPAPPMTIPSQQQVKITRSRARTWASMGNLVEVDIPADSREESSCAEEVASQDREVSALASKARATTSSHADVSENAVGSGAAGGSEQGSSRHRRSGNKMRMSVSGESLHASVSDGGDTDFADLTASEVNFKTLQKNFMAIITCA